MIHIFSVLLSQHRTARQSSSSWGGKASRAVDGDTNKTWDGNSCIHTAVDIEAELAWWFVDLNDTYRIGHIAIWNRDEYFDNYCNVEHLI